MQKRVLWRLMLTPLMITAKENLPLTDDGMAIIKKFDGNILDSTMIGQIMFVRSEISCMLRGVQTRGERERIGKYIFCGKRVTLRQLVAKEKKLKQLQLNTQLSQQQKNSLNQAQAEFAKCLENAKGEFIQATSPFLDRVIRLKKITTPIIEEWAQKRNRLDTLLLEGIRSTQNPIELFDERISSLEILAQFADDLEDFLATFVYNCPRAYEQFKKESQTRTGNP